MMGKLILSEIKKLLKNKWNLALMLFTVALMIFFGLYSDFSSPEYDDYSYATFEGEPLTTDREFLAYADKVLSQYEGEANEALWQRYVDDYYTLYDTFTQEENIDTEAMAEVYGEDWRELLARNEQQQLSDADRALLNQLMDDPSNNYVSEIIQEDDTDAITQPQYHIRTLYQDESRLHTLNAIYLHDGRATLYADPFTSADMLVNTNSLYRLSHPDELLEYTMYLLCAVGNYYVRPDYTIGYPLQEDAKTNLYHFAAERFSAPLSYGSPIPSLLLHRNLTNNNFFTLLILSVIFANSFAIEKTTRCDQLITSTKMGAVRITAAKLCANLLVVFALMSILTLCAFLLTISVVPLTGLNLPVSSAVSVLYTIDIPYLTFGEMIFDLLSLQFLGMFSAVVLISLLSCFSNSRFFTIIAMFAILFAPLMLQTSLPAIVHILSPGTYFQLNVFTTSSQYLYDPMLSNGMWIKDLLWIVWGIFALIAAGAMLWKARLHRVKTK